MIKKSTSQSAFFHLRVLTGLFLVLSGVFLVLIGMGTFSAQAQQRNKTTTADPLVPAAFDCASIPNLGVQMQENLRAGALMIYCGQAQGGSADSFANTSQLVQEMLAPLLGNSDVDLITGAEIGNNVTQSETFTAANPDNTNEIVVAYNDSRGRNANPINISGASVSTDGGVTFTRLTRASTGQSPFANTFGDPVILYNKPTGTWYSVWLDAGCGAQGLGGYKTTTPANADSWTHFCVHTGGSDDRESAWADNNPSSPFYGRMYVTWNDFARNGGAIYVRYSTDNGATWTNERQITNTFFRNVQLTGDSATGTLYLASMNEMGGGLGNRSNLFYKSTDGGNSWSQVYSGPSFAGPGVTTCASNSYFACMFNGPSFWRHMGWGQPAALNNVVHYVYDSRSGADAGNVFYIRSTDGGVTFAAPFQLNTDATTRPQWQPNITVGDDGSLLAVWYDGREATTCSKGNPAVPCYRMWARKSTDNGATWGPDEAFSDVVTPLPGQPDPGIVAEYAGDYDYSFASPDGHIHTWTDGRIPLSGASQQDAFVDQEAIGGGGQTITLTARARARGVNGQVELTWTPADGGDVNVLRDGVVVQTTADDGSTKDKVRNGSGQTFTYQVCETDSGDCSNELDVMIP